MAEIAAARSLTADTILSHLEKLLTLEKIKRAEIDQLLTPALAKVLPEIHGAFHELGAMSLGPVYAKFRGAYSYGQLKIARMLFDGK